jgi:hypothetical protein
MNEITEQELRRDRVSDEQQRSIIHCPSCTKPTPHVVYCANKECGFIGCLSCMTYDEERMDWLCSECVI